MLKMLLMIPNKSNKTLELNTKSPRPILNPDFSSIKTSRPNNPFFNKPFPNLNNLFSLFHLSFTPTLNPLIEYL